MGFQFGETLPSERAALRTFLLRVYEADQDLTSFRPDVLEWKYFAPHPDWNGPRSFLLKSGTEITAHASIWPVRLRTPGSELKGIHLLDWAASRTAPGAGMQILRRIAGMGDLLIAIGGSADTRAILPKLGYQLGGEFLRYVYVVRPWQQLTTRRQYNWKTPLHFLRNAALRLKNLPPVPPGWQATKVSRFESSVQEVLQSKTTALHLRSRRTAGSLNYMLESPAAEFTGFLVSEAGKLRGTFLIARLGRQARIVDIQADAEHARDWHSVCLLSAQVACQDPRTCEVIVGTSRAEILEAFKQLGFWMRRVDPIYYYDPRKLLSPGVVFELSLIDNDFSFLYNSQHPYIS